MRDHGGSSVARHLPQRGFRNSRTRFILRLTREEIGNYLGLTLETVSRLFSRFQAEGLIGVNGKEMRLSDLTALKMIGAGRNTR
jgi:CRP-like cAMP-binding protein